MNSKALIFIKLKIDCKATVYLQNYVDLQKRTFVMKEKKENNV